MQVLFDLIGGQKPMPIKVPYNGSLAVDCVTKRYKGSVVKAMDFDDIDHGLFFTFGGLATIGENVAGILAEEVGTTGNYLPDDAAYSTPYKRMIPCFGSTVIEAEYAQADAAGTSNLDTNATGSLAGTTITAGDGVTGTNGDLAGGWVYFTNGSCADYLISLETSETSGDTITLGTALPAAVAATDDFLVILPAGAQKCLFDATYTGIKSELTYGSHTHAISGISTWISAPGFPMERLSRAKHCGQKIKGARFYHHFTFGGTATLPNYWHGANAG
jgi:hypothetical protein